MNKIGNFNSERNKLLEKARKLISDVKGIIGVVGVEQIDNLKEKEAVNILKKLRKGCSENLNQIPHDFMILRQQNVSKRSIIVERT